MRLKSIFIPALIGAIATGLYYYYAGTRTPLGQAPLQQLSASNFSTLQKRFNDDASDSIRVIVLLSPT
jgi:hypothetical protein